MLSAQQGWFCEYISPMEHVLDIIGDFVELIWIISVESDIDREMEILLRTTSQQCAELFDILELSISVGIGRESAFLIEILLGLELGESFL